MAPGPILERAIELAIIATKEDRDKNYITAVCLYERVIECFLQVIEDEAPGEKAKQAVLTKCCQYSERAEKIREYLRKGRGASDASLISLKKAIELVTKAVEEDHNTNYEEALRLYKHGIEYFMHAMENEARGEKAKEKIRNKCCHYIERSEMIQEYLEKNKHTPIKDGENNSKDEKKSDSYSNSIDPEKKTLLLKLEGAVEVEKPHIKWSDVIGLDATKETLENAVIFPIKFSHLFPGKMITWKGVLLFGPPGTGKSYLAKAIASKVKNSTLFSVSVSDLISKYLAESEKCIKNLFELARQHKPCIIFIDEFNFLCSADLDNESESARRIKTVFLEQMQGVGHDSEGILILGATNMPWDLDADILKLFEKRVYFPLPDEQDRLAMLKLHLDNIPTQLTEEDLKVLARKTKGYSRADIKIVVREFLMRPVCKVQAATHFKRVRGPSPKDPNVIMDDLLKPCSPRDRGAIKMTCFDVDCDKLYQPPLTRSDMLRSLAASKPTVNEEYTKEMEKFIISSSRKDDQLIQFLYKRSSYDNKCKDSGSFCTLM